MPSSAVRTFADPDAYAAAIQGATVELTVTQNTDFAAKLTSVRLHRLWMQRYHESAGTIRRARPAPDRAVVSFLTQPGPEVTLNGIPTPPGRLIRLSPSQEFYRRTVGRVAFASMSLPIEAMAAAGAALAGRDPMRPCDTLVTEPRPDAMARLVRLHAEVGRLAERAPDVIANPATARALEQLLIEVMVACLDQVDDHEDSAARRRHHLIMRRFHAAIAEHPEEVVYLPELCATIGVPERTLRLCCYESLGMGPKRYLTLRRMSLARQALRKADPTATRVTDVGSSFGFWNLGRFAVEYKALFGETPSTTLCGPAPYG